MINRAAEQRIPEAQQSNAERESGPAQWVREHVFNYVKENPSKVIRKAADFACIASVVAAGGELQKYGVDIEAFLRSPDFPEFLMNVSFSLGIGPAVDLGLMTSAGIVNDFREGKFSRKVMEELIERWGITPEEEAVVDKMSESMDHAKLTYWVLKMGKRHILRPLGAAAVTGTTMTVLGEIGKIIEVTPQEAITSAIEKASNAFSSAAEAGANFQLTPAPVPTEVAPDFSAQAEAIKTAQEALLNTREAIVQQANWERFKIAMYNAFAPNMELVAKSLVGGAVAIGVGAPLIFNQEKLINSAKKKSQEIVTDVKNRWDDFFEPYRVGIVTIMGGKTEVKPLKTEYNIKVPLNKEMVQGFKLNLPLEQYLERGGGLGEQEKNSSVRDILVDMLVIADVSVNKARYESSGTQFGEELTADNAVDMLLRVYGEAGMDSLVGYFYDKFSRQKVDKAFDAALRKYNEMIKEHQEAKTQAQQKGKLFDPRKSPLLNRWQKLNTNPSM